MDAKRELYQEYPLPNEEALLRQVEETIRAQHERDYPPSVRPARRDQHPKAHGCVLAEFIVEGGLPDELRVGVFATPRTYPVLIRFSSSSPRMDPDTKRDAHGMALKLVGVPGEKVLPDERDAVTQDFILANNDAFFVRNAADYILFAEAFSTGKFLGFFFGWNPFRWRLHELFNMLKATQKKVSNPLQIRYWSQTPARFGTKAVKYSARPLSSIIDPMPAAPGQDFLRQAMAKSLSAQETEFEFLVQFQTDPYRTPIEDATIPWHESLSPFRRVARIRIPQQIFDTPERDAYAENLSFTPWHTLPEHTPLGSTNRTRRQVYELISKLRHEKNAAPRREPTPETLPSLIAE